MLFNEDITNQGGIAMIKKVHPDLREMFALMPDVAINYNRDNIVQVRKNSSQMMSQMNAAFIAVNDAVLITEKFIPGREGDPNVRIKLYEPKGKKEILPGILHIHGGAYVFNTADDFDNVCIELATDINATIVSVDYRLAPEHPFPAAIDDCYAALKWFSENAPDLGVDSSRIAVFGGSAGGGLTAAVSLLSRDRKGPSIAFQMPNCPMIDDRCNTSSCLQITDGRIYNGIGNRIFWDMYLGDNKEDVSPYAAPARATDLAGLPPTYLCVGDMDPFRDEAIEYAAKLTQAGVPTEFHLYPGCFHGFEAIIPTADISQRAKNEYTRALSLALQK